jgi:hypothetical protein
MSAIKNVTVICINKTRFEVYFNTEYNLSRKIITLLNGDTIPNCTLLEIGESSYKIKFPEGYISNAVDKRDVKLEIGPAQVKEYKLGDKITLIDGSECLIISDNQMTENPAFNIVNLKTAKVVGHWMKHIDCLIQLLKDHKQFLD